MTSFTPEHSSFLSARLITLESAIAAGLSSTDVGIRIKYPQSPAGEAPRVVRKIVDGLALGGAAPALYIPSSITNDKTNLKILLITDCEFEAISACDKGLATVAGPVSEAMITFANDYSAVVVICESEEKSKDAKNAAKVKLTALRQSLPKVAVSIYTLPKASTIGLEPQTVRLSTWIKKEGELSDEIKTIIFRNANIGIRRMTSATEQGYTALGIHEGKFVVYSKQMGIIKQLSPSEIGRKSELMAVMGYDYALAHYPTETGVNWDQATGDVMKFCSQKKIFDVERVRGGGVWEEGGKLIINGLECYKADGTTFDRTNGQNVYNMTRDLGISKESPVGTVAHAKEVLDSFRSWKWKRPTDAYVSLGWLMMAFVSGGLKMRTHAFLHGELGSGKSTFMQLMSLLMGGSSIYLGSVTEAGLRQAVREDAVGILIDEQESNEDKLAKILGYLRKSSTGTKQKMGSDNHQSTNFILRSMGLLAGIVPPNFVNQADSSRFLMMAIEQIDSSKVSHNLVIEAEEMVEDGRAAELGRLMFMRMIISWDRFVEAEEMFRDVLPEGSKRMQSVIAPVLAASWIALHDGRIDIDSARVWNATIDLSEDISRISTASESENFIDFFSDCVPANQDSGRKLSIGQLLDIASGERAHGPASSILGQCGIRVNGNHLQIAPRHNGMLELFAKSKYSAGDLSAVFKRLPGASQKMSEEKLRFGGGARPFLTIPYKKPDFGTIIEPMKTRQTADELHII